MLKTILGLRKELGRELEDEEVSQRQEVKYSDSNTVRKQSLNPFN